MNTGGYDGQCLVAEKDSSGDVQTSYTIGRGEVISRTDWSGETPATVFFLYDGNCNVDAVVDEDGALVRESTYDVFGAVRETLVGSGGDTVGFSGGIGHITDLENSLVYMRARYYDPSLGRFISEDPGRHGTNWYVYCGNNPVNMLDTTGKNAARIEDALQWWAVGQTYIIAGAVFSGEDVITALVFQTVGLAMMIGAMALASDYGPIFQSLMGGSTIVTIWASLSSTAALGQFTGIGYVASIAMTDYMAAIWAAAIAVDVGVDGGFNGQL